MALLDTIKQQLQSPLQGQVGVAPGGHTQTVRQLLQAKTGKAAAPSVGPRQSALQEKAAEAQTQAGQQQLGLRGRIQAEQIGQQQADIAQRTEQQAKQFQEQYQDIQDQFQRQSMQLIDQFERGQKTLKTTKDLADLEQVGFQTRLQNDQYISLQEVGKRNRLDNQLEFKKQLAQNVFKDQQELLVNEIAFQRILSADDREFTEELADMDLNYAMQIADNATKAASQRQVITGVGDLFSTGLKAGGAMGIFDSTSTASPGASGAANTGAIE